MPIYEFDCAACRATFEELVPSERAAADVACPKCGAQHPTKRMSTFAGRMGQSAPAAAGGCPSGGCCLDGACGLA